MNTNIDENIVSTIDMVQENSNGDKILAIDEMQNVTDPQSNLSFKMSEYSYRKWASDNPNRHDDKEIVNEKKYYIYAIGSDIFGNGGWSVSEAMEQAKSFLDEAEIYALEEHVYPCTEKFYFKWRSGAEIKSFSIANGYIDL